MLFLALSACSSSKSGSTGSPPATESSSTASPTESSTTSSNNLPFHSGEVSFELSGSVSGRETLQFLPTSGSHYSVGGSGVGEYSSGSITWGDPQKVSFSLGGNLKTGERKTNLSGADSLSLTATGINDGKEFIISTKGDCSVTIATSSVSELSGRFECLDVKGSSGNYSVKGTFLAKA